MNVPSRRPTLALVAALSLLTAAPVCAQFRVPPGTYVPPAQTQGVALPAAVQPAAVPVPVPTPVPVWGGYGYQTPLNGALTGLADLNTANSQALVTIQQAKLAQEDVTRSRLQTRRQLNDEFNYEYQNRPTQEKLLAEQRAARLTRSRNNPPSTVIWSADALNDLLSAIQENQINFGIRGPSIPLDQQGLQFINVTAGTTPGTVGLFRAGRPLRWPLPLLDDRFKANRDKIEELSAKAVQSVVLNQPDPKALKGLIDAVGELKSAVVAATNDQSPSDNIRSMRYVNQLREGAQTLTDPNALFFLNGKWSARGSTAPELVDYLTANGLRFAPASEGDESFYTALYNQIRAYDASILHLTRAQ